MDAVVIERFGDASVLQWKQHPEPQPSADQIAIKVSVTSLNFADTIWRNGTRPAKLPLVLGLDCAGTVMSVGANVRDFKPGDRVAAFVDGGSYAEIALARPVLSYKIPDGVSDEDACGLVMLVTAWNLVHLAGALKAGQSVLIHAAAGGVGSVAVQLAKKAGAKPVIGTVGDMTKAGVAKECGADLVLPASDFAAGVKEATGGKGVDVILDSVAGATFAGSLEVLAAFGRYVNYGNAGGGPGVVKTSELHANNRSVIGYSSGHYRASRPQDLRPAVEGCFRAIAAGELKIPVSKTFAMKDAAEAHRFIESRKSFGKILLKP
ncbi:MAG TPA: zinc-binding dehydrogenase [Pseudolabrys sp.]|nr:zinc-binding dehydrogenase [Pseudolabrys sp.]